MNKKLITVSLVISSVLAGVCASQTSTLTQGLVAYYHFDGNANDSSGQGNNGTPVNVLYTTDRFGNPNSALLLNGSNAYVQYPDSVFGPATPGFTWSLWVQPNAWTSTYTVWTVMNHGAANGEASLACYGTYYQFGVNFASSGWETATSGTMGTGFVHIICVYQQATQAALWINGQLAASFVPPNEDLFSGYYSTNFSAIGGYLCDVPPYNFFSGVIDDVRIYNRALSNTEVQELFTLEATPTPPATTSTTTVLQQGDPAPGIAGAKFLTTGVPAVNNSMQVAFQATVTGTNAAATKAIGTWNSGIWANDGTGNLQLVVQTGTIAPGTASTVFSALSDPVYNNNNAAAFKGTLKLGTGSSIQNSIGIWSNDGGTLHLVARQGQQAPGLAKGVLFESFSQFVLPDQGGATNTGGVVLMATVVGTGINAMNNQGIWAVDTSGNLDLVVRTGQAVNGKTIQSLTFLSQPSMEGGQTRSYAQSTGNILYKATFTDGSWGICQVVFP